MYIHTTLGTKQPSIQMRQWKTAIFYGAFDLGGGGGLSMLNLYSRKVSVTYPCRVFFSISQVTILFTPPILPHVTKLCRLVEFKGHIYINFVAYLLVGIFSTILHKEYFLCTHILRLKSSFQFPCLKLLLMPSHISYSLVDIGLPSPWRLEFYHGYRISCYLDGCWGRPEPPRSYGRPADS